MSVIRRWVATAVACGVIGPAVAQDTPADRAKAAAAVAGQKAGSDVAQAIADATLLAKSSTVKAVERLRQAQTALDLSATLSSTERANLNTKLTTAISQIEMGVAPEATAKLSAREAMSAAAIEAKEVSEALAKAAKFVDAGKPEEARAAMAVVTGKYPTNPAVLASKGQDFYRLQIYAEKDLANQYAAAWVEHMRGISRDSIPLTQDIQFPSKAKWDQITKLRLQPAVKLTPKEEQLLQSLNMVVKVDFRGRPFKEALQELSNSLQQPIHIEEKSLEDLGLDLGRAVNFSGTVSARTALRAILQGNGLTFVVKDEMIQVLTLDKAQQTLITRSYYLGDLVAGVGQFGNAVQWGPFLSYQQMQDTSRQVVDMITASIDPLAWKTDRTNGPCTVTFNLSTLQLVVRASAEVHASLGSSLTGRK